MNTCMCSHTARDHPGGECVRRACGCGEFREAARRPFGGGLELYPVSLAACPECDSPYGTVHGPECPLDPEKGEAA